MKQLDPFQITRNIGQNSIELDILRDSRLHQIVHVEYTTHFNSQDAEISNQDCLKPTSVIGTTRKIEFVVEKMLADKKTINGYYWLTLLAGDPRHDES